MPTANWRSVSEFATAFVSECYLDEMADALGRGPLDLRLDLEPESIRPVLELAAGKSGWGSALPEGWGRGSAFHSTWNVTPVALIAEVYVGESGKIRVMRVVCAIDYGGVINPDQVESQMEGRIAVGTTAALKGGISIKDGRVQESNFDVCQPVRMGDMPIVESHIVQSNRRPQRVGEMGVLPIAPAIGNAIIAATGIRLRLLPYKLL